MTNSLLRPFFFIFCLFCQLTLQGQEPSLENTNHIFSNNIRTVKFHLEGLPLSNPVVNLNSNTNLVLSFDDIDADAKSYIYTIQLCNADWTLNEDLTTFQYLDGFDEDDIDEYNFGQKTLSNFTNYQLQIPNENMSWTKSGNYILKIFDNEEDPRLVLSRRFMVTESQIIIDAGLVFPASISKQKTHHEIDFDLQPVSITIKNPIEELSVSVLQNGRWDNAITNLKPLYIKDELLSFDYQDKIVFPALKEWRFADVRSLDRYLPNVESIDVLDDGYDVHLRIGKNRNYEPYFFFEDTNGKYIVENFRENILRGRDLPQYDSLLYNREEFSDQQRAAAQRQIEDQQIRFKEDLKREMARHNLVSDYALVYFYLDANQELTETDVYIFGELSDWKLKDEFKMEYNQSKLLYEGNVFLKQGYYNYYYATVREGKKKEIRFDDFEGNWYETENEYLILVYYRPFGQRYDRLIAAKAISSNN